MNLAKFSCTTAVRCATVFLVACFALHARAWAEDKTSPPPRLDCSIGPLTKRYGGTEWLVYACADQQSLVVVSAAGNPAMPFYFMMYLEGSDRRIFGEGAGNKSYSDSAFKEIEILTESDIAALIAAAGQVKK